MSNENNLGYFLQDLIDDAKDAILGNERQTDLNQLAEKHGFRFRKKVKNDRIDIEIKAFDLFKGKKRKRLRNYLMRKDEVIDGYISVFDFHKDTDVGKKITTCVLIQSKYLKLPHFVIRPKKTMEKLGELFSRRPQGLPGYPYFNRMYSIRTYHLDAIDHLFTQHVVDLMVKERSLWLEGNRDYLLLYDKNKEISPQQILGFYELGREIIDIMLYDDTDEFV